MYDTEVIILRPTINIKKDTNNWHTHWLHNNELFTTLNRLQKIVIPINLALIEEKSEGYIISDEECQNLCLHTYLVMWSLNFGLK
jgi:hypothetical protein